MMFVYVGSLLFVKEHGIIEVGVQVYIQWEVEFAIDVR